MCKYSNFLNIENLFFTKNFNIQIKSARGKISEGKFTENYLLMKIGNFGKRSICFLGKGLKATLSDCFFSLEKFTVPFLKRKPEANLL